MTNRADRRARADKYRRIDVAHVCDVIVYDELAGKLGMRECGASLVATFVVERGELAPAVTFRHNPDGTHEPILGGDGMAARSRRSGQIIGQLGEKVRNDS